MTLRCVDTSSFPTAFPVPTRLDVAYDTRTLTRPILYSTHFTVTRILPHARFVTRLRPLPILLYIYVCHFVCCIFLYIHTLPCHVRLFVSHIYVHTFTLHTRYGAPHHAHICLICCVTIPLHTHLHILTTRLLRLPLRLRYICIYTHFAFILFAFIYIVVTPLYFTPRTFCARTIYFA